MHFRWTRNEKAMKTEAKLGDGARITGFSLPQLRSRDGRVTCPFAGSCAAVCYAAGGWYHRSDVQDVYEHNLAVVRRAKTVRAISRLLMDDIEELTSTGVYGNRKPVTHIRFHDSGDFFSRAYYRAWRLSAAAFPGVVFYGYTKSLPLLDWAKHPSNFRVVQSLGGKRDDLVDYDRPHSRIFESVEARQRAGYLEGNDSDLPVIEGVRRIGLVFHGHRTLSHDKLLAIRFPDQHRDAAHRVTGGVS